MSDYTHTELHARILAFCESEGMSKTAFGKIHLGDPSFVSDLGGGRQLLPSTIAKVEAALSKQAA